MLLRLRGLTKAVEAIDPVVMAAGFLLDEGEGQIINDWSAGLSGFILGFRGRGYNCGNYVFLPPVTVIGVPVCWSGLQILRYAAITTSETLPAV